MAIERLQKILAQAGIASRRKAEEMIQLGFVTVNGKVAKIGDKADFSADAIKVEGKLITRTEQPVYLAFYKPRGVISMMADPENRPNLSDYMAKVRARVFPIGRLDFNSEGLLLLTNDGELAEKIQKSDLFPRAYHVKLKGHLDSEMLLRLKRGGKVGNRFVKPHSVRIAEELNKKTFIEIVFESAANVDVKTYFEMKGFLIERMVRTAVGHITLHGLIPGQYRIIPQSKFQALIDQPELGLKAIDYAASKEDEVLPVDLQDKKRKIEPPKVVVAKSAGKVSIRPALSGAESSGRTPKGKGSFTTRSPRRTRQAAPNDREERRDQEQRPSGRDKPRFVKRESSARNPAAEGGRASRKPSFGKPSGKIFVKSRDGEKSRSSPSRTGEKSFRTGEKRRPSPSRAGFSRLKPKSR